MVVNSDYVTVSELAKTAGCSTITVYNYIKISEKSEDHLPFPDIIVLYDGNLGQPAKAIRTEDALRFVEWYKKNGGKRGAYKKLIPEVQVQVAEPKKDRTLVLLRIKQMREDITRIGMEMMGLLKDLEDIESEL